MPLIPDQNIENWSIEMDKVLEATANKMELLKHEVVDITLHSNAVVEVLNKKKEWFDKVALLFDALQAKAYIVLV